MLAHKAIVEEESDAEIALLKAQKEVSRASDVDVKSSNDVSESSVLFGASTVRQPLGMHTLALIQNLDMMIGFSH